MAVLVTEERILTFRAQPNEVHFVVNAFAPHSHDWWARVTTNDALKLVSECWHGSTNTLIVHDFAVGCVEANWLWKHGSTLALRHCVFPNEMVSTSAVNEPIIDDPLFAWHGHVALLRTQTFCEPAVSRSK